MGAASRLKRSRLDRVLSLGQSDGLPERAARRVRVVNALALIGVVLCVASVPIDVFGATPIVVAVDVIGVLGFAACWGLHARGHLTAARVLLMVAADVAIIGGTLALGADPELRTVFFPLALMPFLVFSVTERGWLAVFVAIPVAAYFVIGYAHHPRPQLATEVYRVYAPILTFTMIVTATLAFAYIDHRAEENLLHARARATRNAQLAAVGELSSGIAHELRNPLAAINLAAAQIADRPEAPPQIAQLGERIQRIVGRASRIIEGLRSFARDAGGDPFVATPVSRIVSDTLELCGKRLAERGIALTITPDPVPPELVVECRSVQVAQVLMNLIGNAYDAVASVDDRWVRLDIGVEDGQLELAVTDSGPGVPVPAHARIFEPFFTTKPAERGTGLGLSLSRALIEAHHGTLALDAASAHTRFVIRMPLVQPVARATTT